MKAVKGYTKDYYRNGMSAPVILEFDNIGAAAEYLAKKHGLNEEYAAESIINDTNCDAIWFDDGTVILYEFV